MEKLRKLTRNLSIREVEKPQEQTYDKITYQEVDDVSNFRLPEIKEKIMYETKKLKHLGSTERYYKTVSRDFTGEGDINVEVIDPKVDTVKMEGYYHIAALQILVKFLGNTCLDIPFKLSVRDKRISDVQKSVIGLWTTNLYTGAIYTCMYFDILLSAEDKNLEKVLVIDAEAGIKLEEGSKSIALSYRLYGSWTKAPNPYRVRDSQINALNRSKGKSVIIKPTGMDPAMIPQPMPVEELTYDTEFRFKLKKEKLQVKQSTTPKLVLNDGDSLRIRMETPSQRMSGNRIQNAEKFATLEEYESESDS